jgi:hypothetical protein
MWLPMKPKKYICPANWEIGMSGMHQASHQDGRSKPTVRAMAGKVTGSILIGFERAG